MEQQPAKKRRGPASKLGKILINLIVTAVVGFLYFYVALPPINLQSSDFYVLTEVQIILSLAHESLFTLGPESSWLIPRVFGNVLVFYL